MGWFSKNCESNALKKRVAELEAKVVDLESKRQYWINQHAAAGVQCENMARELRAADVKIKDLETQAIKLEADKRAIDEESKAWAKRFYDLEKAIGEAKEKQREVRSAIDEFMIKIIRRTEGWKNETLTGRIS